jgi:hypothetical protein
MNPVEPVSTQIEVDWESFETRRVMYFDRYAIFRERGNYEFHFGFFGHSQELMQGLILVVRNEVIAAVRESFLQYVKQMGALPEVTDLPGCRLRSPCDVIAADSVGLARHESTAEIIFHAISWKVGVERARRVGSKKTLSGICVAMLRCGADLQKRWVIDICETTENKT